MSMAMDSVENIKKLREQLKLRPNDGSLYFNLGICYQEQGQLQLAVQHYQRALELSFIDAELYNNLGIALHMLGKPEQEVNDCYFKAIRIDPNSPSAYVNLSNSYKRFGKLNLAQEVLEKVIALDPKESIAYYNLGFLHAELNDYVSAIAAYEKCLALNPQYSPALSMLINAAQRLADWDKVDEYLPQLISTTETELAEGEPVGWDPFAALMLPISNELQASIATNKAKTCRRANTLPEPFEYSSKTSKKIRIGYMSADFTWRHPVGLVINNMFNLHDHRKFEVFGYGLRNFADGSGKKIAESFDQFVSLTTLSHEKAAQKIHADAIDILIDLNGFTKFSRPEILAMQPAPIQVHYLDYPGTMSDEFIQYHITNKVMLDTELAKLYSEKLVYLPEALYATTPFDMQQHELKRIHFNLPEDKFIYCCFNTVQRIDREVFATWMAILKQVPDSVMWLQAENNKMVDNLKKAAIANGVAEHRIVFAPPEAMTTRWRHRLADLWLDTFMLSGGTSGMLNAYAGLPVLTWRGPRPQMRTGAAIANATGMTDLVVDSKKAYIEKAIWCAEHSDQLTTMRQQLIDSREQMPLFDPQRLIRYLEQAYVMIWERYQQGKAPINFKVPAITNE
jgi:protein O-GlcNAc transferase